MSIRVIPNKAKFQAGKVNSQLSKTWFMDKHVEAMLTYSDGSHYTYPVEYMDHTPQAGEPKHYEWVWNNNHAVVQSGMKNKI